jgi:hypothetical protein
MRTVAATPHSDDSAYSALSCRSRTSHFDLIANFRPHGVPFFPATGPRPT